MKNKFDIIIVGGGLVGTTLALSLKSAGFNIALVEAFIPPQHQQAVSDMRSLALNFKSREIFKNLDIWPELEQYSTPIKKIHVSEKSRFGKTLLESPEESSFGSVIPIPYLYNTLQKNLETLKNITVLRPAKLTGLISHENHWELEINQENYKTGFLIACDGEKSFIRDYLKIPVTKTDLNQTALVTTLFASESHKNTAYERFTDLGILALLPLQNNRMAAIWTVENSQADSIKNNFLKITQESIGYRLGKLSDLATIQTYPIYELMAEKQVLNRFILLGNSAHVLHPVAAQGLNLSLRDVEVLAKILLNTADLSGPTIQQNYLQARLTDQKKTIKLTNNILKIFDSHKSYLSILRSKGLFLLDLIPPLKNQFSQTMMGLE